MSSAAGDTLHWPRGVRHSGSVRLHLELRHAAAHPVREEITLDVVA